MSDSQQTYNYTVSLKSLPLQYSILDRWLKKHSQTSDLAVLVTVHGQHSGFVNNGATDHHSTLWRSHCLEIWMTKWCSILEVEHTDFSLSGCHSRKHCSTGTTVYGQCRRYEVKFYFRSLSALTLSLSELV